jgi:hypothetical protein
MTLFRRYKQWTLNVDRADDDSQTYRLETDTASHSEGLEPTLENASWISAINGNCMQMRIGERLKTGIMADSHEFNVASQ